MAIRLTSWFWQPCALKTIWAWDFTREGGNCDIKNLKRAWRLYLAVYVDGAKLSLGDLHFSQGDGELTFYGAIEMAGFIDVGIGIIKNGMNKYGMRNPIFKTGNAQGRTITISWYLKVFR